jgi:4-hydroxy-tetrahydrodipicolinate synthase
MATSQRIRGVLAPVLTPFTADLAPDSKRLIAHCRWLLHEGAGLAVFGTTSEANSMSVDERSALLDALVEGGIDASRMMPGTGACALADVVRLTRQAVASGCAGVLMLPPFYYKGVSDEGLYRHFSEVVERVGDARLRIYLYHIPPVAVVGISAELIARLIDAYPGTFAGLKDSSGDFAYTKTLLERFAPAGFDVFVGHESALVASMRQGGAGCISAIANVNPRALHQLYENARADDADARQAAVDRVRTAFGKYPMIAALKAFLARATGDPHWSNVRPPLMALTSTQAEALAADLDAIAFALNAEDARAHACSS